MANELPRPPAARTGRCRWGRRLGRARLAASVLAAAGLVTGIVPGIVALAARAADVTASQNNLRDGWDPTETSLTPAVLRSGKFGKLFSTAVNGQVFAQPVVAGNTVIVATETDWVYGLNAVSGAIEWSRQLGTPWPSDAEGCSFPSPEVGVTGTPVYDPSTGTVYLTSEEVPAGHSPDNPEFFMHAINAQTGAERAGWPAPSRARRPTTPAARSCRSGNWSGPGSCCSTDRCTRHSDRTATSRRTPATWPGSTPRPGRFRYGPTRQDRATARPASGRAAAG